MHVEVQCPSCQGKGKKWIGYSDFMNCLNCHGTGRITKYVNTLQGNGSGSASTTKIDTRTDEEKKADSENAIASFLSFCLGAIIAVPVLMEGVVAWWIPTTIGIVIWFTIQKVFKGPFRIIPVLIRKVIILTGTLLGYTILTLVVGGFLYFVFRLIQLN